MSNVNGNQNLNARDKNLIIFQFHFIAKKHGSKFNPRLVLAVAR